MEVAYYMYCADNTAPPSPEQPILELLASPHALESGTRNDSGFEWAELTSRFISSFPQYAARLFESVIGNFGRHDFALDVRFGRANKVVTELIGKDPKRCWKIVQNMLSQVDTPVSHGLLFWLGPSQSFGAESKTCALAAFDTADVLEWVEQEPDVRAHSIARSCPKSLDPSEGGELARQLLIRFGNQKEVISGLHCNFYSEGFNGKRSDHYRRKRERFANWMTKESAPQVVSWLEREIDSLGLAITSAEIEEEQRF